MSKTKKPSVPKAVIFYGPPGSGKGTQAELLVKKTGYRHFDTGRYIEAEINDPEKLKSPIVKRQKKLFMSGKLCEPKWVISIVEKPIKEFSGKGFGLVFSGSPRVESEAFGVKGKKNGTVELLENAYGRKNMIVFWLNIPVAESVRRNSLRGRPGLDQPKIIRVRCREYKKETLPILKRMKERGIKIVRVNASPKPQVIAREVFKKFKEFERGASS